MKQERARTSVRRGRLAAGISAVYTPTTSKTAFKHERSLLSVLVGSARSPQRAADVTPSARVRARSADFPRRFLLLLALKVAQP